MFPWNIAKSAEGMFSRWAIKNLCKFLLKKKLGQCILGDIDLDQLDVQLAAGTIQLNDLALDVDYLNQKLGTAAVIVKEGSIGSLLVRIPWQGESCQIEVDELELVLGLCVGNNSLAGAEIFISSQDGKQHVSHGLEKPEHEMVNSAATSVSLDVHEGVKTIAKMVKWLLTSFHVKIKNLIVAFDPCLEKDENRSVSHTSLIFRIKETECGTHVSEEATLNNDSRVESFLGMSRLTNFVKFQGGIVELLQMEDVDKQTQVPILTGEAGGFSGTLKLSIPWKNGSLDIRKVDADVSIDPVELRFQPSTVKWFICLWESLKIFDNDGKCQMHYKATDSIYFNAASQCHSSTIDSAVIATDRMMPYIESSSAGFCSLTSQETVTDALLPGSHFIPDWVSLSINKNQKDRGGAEPDLGASIDQFFECFDGMRNSQSALGNSGMWNWTCSVFSAITAASSLASGSLHIPSDTETISCCRVQAEPVRPLLLLPLIELACLQKSQGQVVPLKVIKPQGPLGLQKPLHQGFRADASLGCPDLLGDPIDCRCSPLATSKWVIGSLQAPFRGDSRGSEGEGFDLSYHLQGQEEGAVEGLSSSDKLELEGDDSPLYNSKQHSGAPETSTGCGSTDRESSESQRPQNLVTSRQSQLVLREKCREILVRNIPHPVRVDREMLARAGSSIDNCSFNLSEVLQRPQPVPLDSHSDHNLEVLGSCLDPVVPMEANEVPEWVISKLEEQQHIETNLKATVARISVVFSLHDEDKKHSCDLNGDRTMFGSNVHYLGAKCRDLLLVLQICPQATKFEAMVNHVELDDYFNNGNEVLDFGFLGFENNIHGQSLLIQHRQAEVQGALPPFPLSMQGPDSERSGLVTGDISFGTASMNGGISGIDCRTIPKDDLVKVKLLETSSVSSCQITMNSSSSNDSVTGSTSFSVKLPPFVFWVNFHLVNMLLDLLRQVGNSFEVNSIKNCFGSEVFSEKHDSSCHVDVKRGTCPHVTPLSPKGSLQGSIFLPNARVILCFPFENSRDYGRYFSWDQFIVLNVSLPLSKEEVQCIYPIPKASSQKGYSSTASHYIRLNIGNLDMYLITSSCKDDVGSNSCAIQRQAFSAQKILSFNNGTGCLTGISMLWQDGPLTGPWIAERARSLATSQDSSRNKVVGKGYEFSSVTAVKDLDDINSHTRQEMILSSAFFLHVHLPSVWINLNSSEYKCVHRLVSQVIDGLSCVACDTKTTPCINEEFLVSQTSVLMECDSVEILINLDVIEDINHSIQKELPGSWHNLKLKLQKFEFLSVSNIGGIRGSNFLWVGHGEGKLWGSITGVPDQELPLISCSNSTMKRGDGEGANALSSSFAGSAIVHLWDPQSFQSFSSIAVRCCTIVAPGGRLDWLNAISFFFSLPSPEDGQVSDNGSQKGSSVDSAPYQSSFVLNLVDIALSYEPHIKNLVACGVSEPVFNMSPKLIEETREQYVACLLAAASFSLSNKTVADSMDNDYKIRVQDLGLLLCALSGSENASGTYSVEYLHKIGYVKVAGDALVEAILRTNCKNGLLWEVECSESHINLDTCQDTTSGLIHLAAQLQQLFAPDVEESLVHLQSRWNNFQQAQDSHDIIYETKIFDADSASSPSHVHASNVDVDSRSGVVGLMDEICEDAFHLNGNRTSPSDSCESQFHISFDEGLLGDVYNLEMSTPEILSGNFSFNGSMPGVGLGNSQTSFLQKDCFPEFIEGYCLSDLHPLSDFSVSNQSLNRNFESKSRNVGKEDVGSENIGWYEDTSLRIVENHISKVSDHPRGKTILGEGKLPSINCIRPDDFCAVKGRVVLKNIDVRWRMHAGSDWHDSGENVQNTENSAGRDATVCLELSLSGLDLQYDNFHDGEIFVSKLSLSVQDIHLYDSSMDAPWKLVLGYYHSKSHPRESSAKAFKLDLEAVRPDPSIPLEEYRLCLYFLPVLLHLHQGQLDFLISFFGGKGSPLDQSAGLPHDLGGSRMLQVKNSTFGGHTIAEEALLPYFQARLIFYTFPLPLDLHMELEFVHAPLCIFLLTLDMLSFSCANLKFDICPVLVRVDYSPCRVDLAALRDGKYVELVNLVPWKGVELQLKHVHAVGVYGWSSVCETIVGEWLEDISKNQIHKLLKGIPTIRSLFAVGSGAAKLVSMPVKNYRKDHRLFTGMQREGGGGSADAEGDGVGSREALGGRVTGAASWE
ncbi:hypothetical protein HHK36_008419 [Tetracentron sinense]|uniref:Autophagy-related protein 2 n=1 Tax=Tetracentron sinense TaxID=13715 RepID=A0A834ZGM6_TETSI|nr:hypothetical protein HHK36_008419 [Tetracentron sinense]